MVQQKYSKVTQRTKEIKNYTYQLRTKLTKHKLENKTKARCQLGNKAMKIKLTNMLRLKERYAFQCITMGGATKK